MSHSPATVFAPPVPKHTTGPVVGGWRGKDKSYFDNASPIDSDPFQVSSRFPNLVTVNIHQSRPGSEASPVVVVGVDGRGWPLNFLEVLQISLLEYIGETLVTLLCVVAVISIF